MSDVEDEGRRRRRENRSRSGELMDPFASILEECGEPDEEEFQDAVFITLNPNFIPQPDGRRCLPGLPKRRRPLVADCQGVSGFRSPNPATMHAGSSTAVLPCSNPCPAAPRSAEGLPPSKKGKKASSSSANAQPQPPPAKKTRPEGPNYPTNIFVVMKDYSKSPDRGPGDLDILDIATRVGLDFPKPRWWRERGYD